LMPAAFSEMINAGLVCFRDDALEAMEYAEVGTGPESELKRG
jgi:hypothetical protein